MNCKNCAHAETSPTGGFVPNETHCWVIECPCKAFVPSVETVPTTADRAREFVIGRTGQSQSRLSGEIQNMTIRIATDFAQSERLSAVREAFAEVEGYLKRQWRFADDYAKSSYKAGDREQVGWNGGIDKSIEAMADILKEM